MLRNSLEVGDRDCLLTKLSVWTKSVASHFERVLSEPNVGTDLPLNLDTGRHLPLACKTNKLVFK